MKISFRKYPKASILTALVLLLFIIGGMVFYLDPFYKQAKGPHANCTDTNYGPVSDYIGLSSSEARAKIEAKGGFYRVVRDNWQQKTINLDFVGCGRRVNVSLVLDRVRTAEYY
jgi:hypothetical protein